MQTLSNIVRLMENFGTRHLSVETFSFGKALNMADVKNYELPLLHVIYTGSNTSERQKTYNFNVFILSRTSEDSDSQEQYEMISDMEAILHDLLSEVRRPQEFFLEQQNNLSATLGVDYREYERQYTDNNFQLDNVRSAPLVEQMSGRFCGIESQLSITVSAPADSCYTPYS